MSFDPETQRQHDRLENILTACIFAVVFCVVLVVIVL